MVFEAENLKNANEFAKPGTVMHFAMRLGFMPHNEEAAEKLLKSIVDNEEKLQSELDRLKRGPGPLDHLIVSYPVPTKMPDV